MTYEYHCDFCDNTFEEFREMDDRYRKAMCVRCGGACKKIISVVNFNEIFPGSTKQLSLAEHYTRESIEAQKEGFRSKGEIETAIGMAEERAKQMGKPGKQLIGPVESPFKGEAYKPTTDEVHVADNLVRRNIEASHSGSRNKIVKAREALTEHESKIKAKTMRNFKPKHSKSDLTKQIKESREHRKA